MDSIDPHINVIGVGQRPLIERRGFTLPLGHQPRNRGPRQASGGVKEPLQRRSEIVGLDKPCRYHNGNTSANCGDFRAHPGRIAEANRRHSPLASTRLSLTHRHRTGTAPAAVTTSRLWW
jgi:hypothetical protein